MFFLSKMPKRYDWNFRDFLYKKIKNEIKIRPPTPTFLKSSDAKLNISFARPKGVGRVSRSKSHFLCLHMKFGLWGIRSFHINQATGRLTTFFKIIIFWDFVAKKVQNGPELPYFTMSSWPIYILSVNELCSYFEMNLCR